MKFMMEQIRGLLAEAFKPDRLEIQDLTDQHRSHPGAQGGGGHYRVLLVSALFEGETRIQRHRRVHEILKNMMGSSIHALALDLKAPSEVP